jgi:hypothetical protein
MPVMRLPFAGAAAVAAIGLTGYLVAGVSRRPPPSVSASPAGAATARVEPERLVDTARLGRALDRMPREVVSRRNPFRFGGRARVAPAAPIAADETPGGWAEPVRPERPALQLLGIAEDVAADGSTVRTAVVVAMNQLHLVKEGEQVALRFLVRRVGADVIEIEDLSDDTVLRLPLR